MHPANTTVSLETVYRTLRPRLLASACRFTDPASAEDAVQELFVNLLAARDTARRLDQSYVFAALRNVARTLRRRCLRRAVVESSVPAGGCIGPAAPAALERSEALAGLPEDPYHALRLTGVAGLTATQAARVLGVSRTTLERQRCTAICEIRTAAARTHRTGTAPAHARGSRSTQ